MLTFEQKQSTVHPRRAELKERATQSELIFKKRLDEAGIKYIFQKGFIQGDFYCIVDFYLPKPLRTCIEIDGGYHDTDEQRKKDWAKDNYLKNRKMKVVRIRNENVSTFDLSSL